MNGLLRLIYRAVVRPVWREPARALLTVFAIALGVGVVVAMDLAGVSASQGFQQSVESLAGNADAEITMTGGIPEDALAKLEAIPEAFSFSARIEDFAFLPSGGEAIPFLGLDLIGDPNIREVKGEIDSTIRRPIWVGSRLGWKQGQSVALLLNDRRQTFTVAGVLPRSSEQVSEENFIVADIGLAQAVTGKSGKIDSITCKFPPGLAFARAQAVLKKVLPAAASVEPRGTRRGQNQRMLDAFRWNLRILSYISLLVGGFLIYNTISISVVRRRSDIGVMRAIGMTRRTVLCAFLIEALCFAIAGSAVGVPLGRLMADGAETMVNGTVQMLYVTGRPGALGLAPSTVLTGIGLGVLVSLLAALGPAVEASRVAPVEAMARGRLEYVVELKWRITLPLVVACALGGLAFSKLPPLHGQPVFGYVALMLLIAGTAAATPGAVALLTRSLRPPMPIEALLAARSLRSALGRTSVLVAALTTAIAMTASVGIMVGSFRETLAVWMSQQLKADFYLRPAAVPGGDRYPTMSIEVARRIAAIPDVTSLDLFRAYPITYRGLPTTLAGGNLDRIMQLPVESRVSGDVRKLLRGGRYLVVSEPLASKHGLHAGDVMDLPIGRFQIAEIYYDYSSDRGIIMLDRDAMLRCLPDPNLSSLAVYVRPGANPSRVRKEIDDAVAGHAVFVANNVDLRRSALKIVDNTFQVTYALEAVAIFVAVMGVAGALFSLVMDRRREFALVRMIGGAAHQTRRIILWEAALMGLVATVLGSVLGALQALILIFVINKQSFGWTLQLHWPVGMLCATLAGVYCATVLSGLYPSRMAKRLHPVEVLHES